VALVPQVVKAFQTRHTKDISLAMFVLTASGVFLWAIYGFFINSAPVMIANTATLGLCLTLISLKIKYG